MEVVHRTVILTLMLLGLVVIMGACQSAQKPNSSAAPVAAGARAKQAPKTPMPLTFEANVGQLSAKDVDFMSRGSNYSVYLRPSDVTVYFRRFKQGERSQRPILASTAAFKIRFLGANPNAVGQGVDQFTGKTNYIRGRPSEWHIGVGAFSQVRYKNIYQGIDILYYGNSEGRLEYDFIVAPGAEPAAIEFDLEGVDDFFVDNTGSLHMTIDGSTLEQKAPVAYQEIDGARTQVSSHYVATGLTTVALALSPYDLSRTLVIDPTLVYSTYLGGSAVDAIIWSDLARDGSYHIAGYTASLDFPTTSGVFNSNHSGGSSDAFVAKINPNGTLAFATYIGGSGDDYAIGLAADGHGNTFIAGFTDSSDFPVTPRAFQSNNNGGIDAFVAKVDSAGAGLIYSTYLGGSGDDFAFITPDDAQGRAHVCGYTSSTDFPVTEGAFQTANAGGVDSFVTRMSRSGSDLVYSTYIGGSGDDLGIDGNLDHAGHVFLDGNTDSEDFPVTATAFQAVSGGGVDAFAIKLAIDGSELSYASYLGGSGHDEVFDYEVDHQGNGYIVGSTTSIDFPVTFDAMQLTHAGGFTDGFLAKIDPRGDSLILSTYVGGSRADHTGAVQVDRRGRVYVAGQTSSLDFPITAGAFQPTYGGGSSDAFVMKLLKDGTLEFSSYVGGRRFESLNGFGSGLSMCGEFMVSGGTGSDNFPTTANALQPSFGGRSDAFVIKVQYSTCDEKD